MSQLAPWPQLVPWIETHDEHAHVHLRLFEQAQTLLEREGPAAAGRDEALADRLERWRYHLLKQAPEEAAAHRAAAG